MKKNIAMLRKIGGLSLAGALTLGSTAASAVDFTAQATVQNALSITATQQMSLGNIFATTTASSKASILRLAPAGGFTTIGTNAGSLIALGGQTPAVGSITIGATTAFDVELPEFVFLGAGGEALAAADAAAATGTTPSLATMDETNAVRLQIDGGGPFPSLFLVNFRAGAGTGTDSISCVDLSVAAASGNTCTVTPTFFNTAGGTTADVTFAIGADVVTEVTTAVESYQEGLYSGTFTVTATY